MKTEHLLTELNFPFKRMSLKKDWVKAKLNPTSKVEICNHENKEIWDFGIAFKCNDCNSLVRPPFIPYAKLI